MNKNPCVCVSDSYFKDVNRIRFLTENKKSFRGRILFRVFRREVRAK